MEKQIIATLEIASHEVRLLVGQFFNGRLNILKVERVPHMGMNGLTIMSESIIIEAIKKAVENASRNLGVVISQVILNVPGVHMKHVNQQIEIAINGRISELDLKRTYESLMRQEAPQGYIVGNVCFSRFINNGISSRKVPIGDKSQLLICDVDIYYVKQSIVFPFVGCVEKSGLGIIDIVMDDLALAKETSAMEASVDRPVMAITISEDVVRYSLYIKGKFVSNDVIEQGMHQFSSLLRNTLRIPSDVTHRLLYYNLNLSDQGLSDDPLFMWSSKSQTHTISEAEIAAIVAGPMRSFLDVVIDRFSPVYQLGKPKILIMGELVTIDGLKEYLETISDTEVELYVSPTIGVRHSSLSSVLGAFYFYKDNSIYRDHSLASVDESVYMQSVLEAKKHEDEESLTQKLKNMFIGR